MREIKFKLVKDNKTVGYEKWFPDAKCWGFEDHGCWAYSKDGFIYTTKIILHNSKYQFTGLKDKNGREIYEGDIVSECVVGQVIWNGDAEILSCPCGVVTQYPTYLNLSQDKKGLVRLLKPKWKLQAGDTYNLFLSKYDGLYTWPKDIEVIGNIYESPELLS